MVSNVRVDLANLRLPYSGSHLACARVACNFLYLQMPFCFQLISCCTGIFGPVLDFSECPANFPSSGPQSLLRDSVRFTRALRAEFAQKNSIQQYYPQALLTNATP